MIQEITVARKRSFLCGRLRTEPDDIEALALSLPIVSAIRNPLLFNSPESVKGPLSTAHVVLLSGITAEYGENGPLDFVEILSMTSAFYATDPRDKIFALIGITNDGPPELIDYTRSLRELLIDVCTRFLNTAPSSELALSILSYVHHDVQPVDLPSWVPSWDFKGLPQRPLNQALEPKEWIDVGTGSFPFLVVRYRNRLRMRSCIPLADSPQRLVVRGKIVDRIRTLVQATPLSHPVPEDVENQQRQEWDAEVSKLVTQLRTYPTGMPIEEALWRSLCFNGGEIEEPAPLEWGNAYKAYVGTF